MIFDTLRAKEAQIIKQSKTKLLKALSKCHYTLKMLTYSHINCAYFTFAFRYYHECQFVTLGVLPLLAVV